jgi:hypothetical protein
MHWYREGSRQRSRILYVFRTPGGVRVGRDLFEPEVRRQIEAQHPDIDFDWAVVRENQQIIETNPEPRRRRPRREGDEAAPAPPEVQTRSEPAAPAPPPAAPPMPSAIQGQTPDEQVAFLTEWYPQLRERVIARISDPVRQATLLELTERLNPITWTDADQITTGLQSAAEALERLAHVLTKRRRRPRRKRGSAAAPSAGDAGSPDTPETSDLTESDEPADEGAES